MAIDFVDCNDEKIHIPGYIQDFGYLLGLDSTTKEIKFLSENLSEIFHVNTPLFGNKLEDFSGLFEPILTSKNYKDLSRICQVENSFFLEQIEIGGKTYHFTIFRTGENIFLQFEKALKTADHNGYVSRSYESINNSKTESAIWENLLSAFGDTINYDRMMVYRFLEDGSGVVVAEKKKDNIESYLNLHYPESDIPIQARALYLKKRKRILSNADAPPVPIICSTDAPIDLTYSNLRAMSPIHVQYLKNGNATSSFSTSIVVNDELWGLVTCQNRTSKHIDLIGRIRAEVFTILAANTYTALKAKQNLEISIAYDKKNALLMHKLLKFDDLDAALYDNIEEICGYPDAAGLAVITGEKVVSTGLVPSEEDILKIRDWIKAEDKENYFASNEFRNRYFPQMENAAGICAVFLDNTKKEFLIWFRQEEEEDILWAGNPEKAFESVMQQEGEKMLVSPRKSFAIYKESIKGKSAPWKTKDLLAIKKVSEILLEASHNQFVKVKALIAELKEVNEELDSFSYSISHDLGTPLTVMKLNAQMLLSKNKDNPYLQKKLNGIVTEIDGMANMMREVLQLSRAKSVEINLVQVPTKTLIEKINSDAIITYGTEKTQIIVRDCPDVCADKTLLHQVFQNVITNAVKYSSQTENPVVEVSGAIVNDKVIFEITDNGIGIQKEQQDKMFKIFQRMDNARNFKGNGVGLSIVDRIMLRLGGSISYESIPNERTTFFLTFKKP